MKSKGLIERVWSRWRRRIRLY